MKKAIGQTVRDLKREVNKKVLKVPGIEQKVLDATCNEAWGPHGSLLSDIARASKNYHEHQMIMAIIWKRINDTGKNWRHVYKALIVLEYLVGHGSERVIDDIREHAHQISTLSTFQYMDSSGRDQGNNVRKKSQSLVLLVNDKEKIIEVRQKAAANRDKFHNNSSGGMYRPSSYSGSGPYGDRYEDDRYGSNEEDRSGYGYGRERELGNREDDRYGRDGDRNARDYEEHYNKDSHRDDEYRERSQSVDDYQYASRSRNYDGDHDRSYDDDGQHSIRLEQKLSEQNTGAPPSYEEALGESRSPSQNERAVETSAASAPRGSSPVSDDPRQTSASTGSAPLVRENPSEAIAAARTTTSGNQEVEASDEFDPRGPVSAAPAATSNVEMDLLGSLSESFSSSALTIVPSSSATANVNLDSSASFTLPSSGSNNFSQAFQDPFGDSPFKAIFSTETASSQSQTNERIETSQSSGPNTETGSNFGFGDSFSVAPYSTAGAGDTQLLSTNSLFLSQDAPSAQETDILADILPPAPLSATSQLNFSAPPDAQSSASSGQVESQPYSLQTGPLTQQAFSAATGESTRQPFSVPTGQLAQHFSSPSGQLTQQAFSGLTGQPVQLPSSTPASQHAQQPFSVHAVQPAQSSGYIYGGFHSQVGSVTPGASSMFPLSQRGHYGPINSGNFPPLGYTTPISSHMTPQAQTGQPSHSANYFPQHGGSTAQTISSVSSQSPTNQSSQFSSGNFMAQPGSAAPFTHQPLGVRGGGGKQNEVLGSFLGQGANAPNASQYTVPSTGSNYMISQPFTDKFETKSTVWTDTLSKGLVNLNISGAKINPLTDIGIDFDAINRKEKRMEKATTTTVTSFVTMGKAMGSGSGIGRAGAGALRPLPNPSLGSGLGMGMSMGTGNNPGVGMGMGSYRGVNAPMVMGMDMGMGMGMNMGMGQGVQMQPLAGLPPGSNIPPGNYNFMMGTSGYPQHPYGGGGGYR